MAYVAKASPLIVRVAPTRVGILVGTATTNGHWDSPLHRRCPNGPPGPEWKTS